MRLQLAVIRALRARPFTNPAEFVEMAPSARAASGASINRNIILKQTFGRSPRTVKSWL